MKNIKKEIAAFIIICIFILTGLVSHSFAGLVKNSVIDLLSGKRGISATIDHINDEIDKTLSYHDALMDLNSVIMRYTGTRYVKKDNVIVSAAENGMLSGDKSKRLSDKQLKAAAEKILELKNVSNSSGAEFLYVFSPNKNMYLSLPAGVDNHALENYEKYIALLTDLNINVLDLPKEKDKDNISVEEMYFITDHHWKPESGLWAAAKICESLQNVCPDFKYEKEYTELNNYDVKTYKDWFLGSIGKKVGRFFSPLGIDDIDLLTPRFETSLIEKQPAKDETKSGSFTETVMDLKQIEEKDLYDLNPYAAYSGGDFRLQISENKKAPNDSKILVVRDSYACVVTPFLALNCKELHVVDVRDYKWFVGKKLDLKDYIKSIRPDCVIVLYNGVTAVKSSHGLYDFF